MATITFGGGPELSARKGFCNLKDGTQVPGYRGYIPHIKYAIGKTYGCDTHELSKSYMNKQPLLAPGPGPKPPLKNQLPTSTGDNKLTETMVPGYTDLESMFPSTVRPAQETTFELNTQPEFSKDLIKPQIQFSLQPVCSKRPFFSSPLSLQGDDSRHFIIPNGDGLVARPPRLNKLPSANGDRKLIKEMKPGYTGFIPRKLFKYGDTYKVDCDYSIDEHMTNMKKHDSKYLDLVNATRTAARLTSVQCDPAVKDRLNTYKDGYPGRPMLMDDKRALTEPPMPGYQGYIPRIGQTELGLGNRYHKTTKLGFEDFYAQTAKQASRINEPIDITRATTDLGFSMSKGTYAKRIYPSGGMIPKYTGYVPQRRYQFGNTYGDTTRSLDVCAHPKDCFGDYLKTQPKAKSAFVC